MLDAIFSNKKTSILGLGSIIVVVLTQFGPMIGISPDGVAALEKLVLLFAGGGFFLAKDGDA